MNKIRVFALPAHHSVERTSGVDFVRIIQPMEYLAKHPDFEVNIWDHSQEVEWPEIARDYDIIFLNYMNNEWGFAAMGAMAQKYGTKIIMDVDDALHKIKPDNMAYDIYKKGSRGITVISAIFDAVDHMTCTNKYLKNILLDNTHRTPESISVIDNYINLDTMYTHRLTHRNAYDVVIAHFGSASHFVDLQSPEFIAAIDRLMKEYPNLRFETIGSFFPDIKMKYSARYIQEFGDVDIYKWVQEAAPRLLENVDIIVAPLIEDVYNRAKSGVKRLEAASFMRPFVGQKIRQYKDMIVDDMDGYLCSTEDEWYKALKRLIDNPKWRKGIAEEAFTRVRRDHQMKHHVNEYADLFKKVLDK